MGGRGTFAAGKNVPYRWETIGYYNGVKMVDLIDKRLARKLPEESHSSKAYILFDRNGVFHQYREYNDDHTVSFEIGYHVEKNLRPDGQAVLHYHKYTNGFEKRESGLLTDAMYNKYKGLFKGVL